jgi:hypothetical protein
MDFAALLRRSCTSRAGRAAMMQAWADHLDALRKLQEAKQRAQAA